MIEALFGQPAPIRTGLCRSLSCRYRNDSNGWCSRRTSSAAVVPSTNQVPDHLVERAKYPDGR